MMTLTVLILIGIGLAVSTPLWSRRREQACRERQHLPAYIEYTPPARPRPNGAHDGYTWSG